MPRLTDVRLSRVIPFAPPHRLRLPECLLRSLRTGTFWALMVGVIFSLALPDPYWGLLSSGLLPLFLYRRQLGLVAGVLGFLLGSLNGILWLDTRLPKVCTGESMWLTGRVDSLPHIAPADWGGWRVTAVLGGVEPSENRCRGPRRVLLTQHLETLDLQRSLSYGAAVSALVRFRPLSSQHNPGVLPDQGRWVSRGVDAAATVTGPVSQTDRGGWLADFRRTLLADWSMQAGQGWIVLRALLLGDTRGISPSLWGDLKRLGIVHLVVISGLHIALLAGLTTQLAALPRRLWRLPRDRGTDAVTILATLLISGMYVLLIGAPLPAQRAFMMLCAAKAPQLWGWSSESRRSLSLAITVMLLWEPKIALGASFWLSAGATWILVTDTTTGRSLLSLLRLQLKLVVFMAPLTLFWFGEASWLGVAANLVMVPAVTLVMVPTGLAGAVLTAPFPTLSQHLLTLSAAVWDALMPLGSGFLRSCDLCDLVYQPLPLIGFMITVFSVLSWGSHRWASILAYLLTLAIAFGWPRLPHEPTVTVLDVGQGLAVVVEGNGKTLVYDTGDGYPGGFSQAEKILVPYLRSRGVQAIDALVVSHSDRDHSGGLSFLKDQMPIYRHLGFGGEPCRNGERWRWGALEILLVNGAGQSEVHSNDQSCGFLLSVNGSHLLALGDMSAKQERELVRYWKEALAADFLVVAHHGSDSSSSHAVLKWVDPTWALISAGLGNRFGHPHSAVLERLRQKPGLEVVNTAKAGAIQIVFTGSASQKVTLQRGAASPYWLQLP